MKTIKSLLALFLLAIAGVCHAESINVAPVTLQPGGIVAVPINCEFTCENITLYQFDLYLPEGVTLVKNNKDRFAAGTTYVLSARHDEHVASLKENTGFVRFVVSQNDAYTIAAGSGELLTIYLQADASVTGDLQGSIKNFMMFETDETKHAMTDITFTMTVPTATIPVSGVSLDMSSATLTQAGETLQLTATVIPDDATDKSVTWESSDTNVATVDGNGLVTAVANGTATITVATADGTNLSATCEVTVNIEEEIPDEHEYVTDLSQLSNYKLYTLTCERGQMVLKADGESLGAVYATENQYSRTDFTEAETQFAILTIDEKFYIYSPYLGRFLTYNNTLDATTGSALTFDASYAYDDFLWVVNANNATGTLWMNLNNNGSVVLDNWQKPDIGNRWRIEAVADFDPTEALAAFSGELATGISLDCGSGTLTQAGETLQLTATVEPDDATDKSVTWVSSNTNVATVDEYGLVTAVANGTATIAATTSDGTNLSATCVVTVNDGREYVTDLAQLSNYKLYTLTCERGQMVVKADGEGLGAVYAYESQYSRTDFTEAETQFAILTIDEKFYLYSPYLGRFLTNENTLDATTGSALTFDASYAYDNFLWVVNANTALGTLWMNMAPNGSVILDDWQTPDGGNRWRIEAVADFDPTEALAAFSGEFGVIDYSEIQYYLYNIDADMFLNYGNSWGTHAVLAAEGTPVRIAPDDTHTYIYVTNSDGTERLLFRESGGDDGKIFVDGDGNRTDRQYSWPIIDAGYSTYVIKAADRTNRGLYLGNIPARTDWDYDTNEALESNVDIVCNATATDNIHWQLWTQLQYDNYIARTQSSCDVTGDGRVSISDVTKVVNAILTQE